MPFIQVLRDCARAQNVNPQSAAYDEQYAGELAESLSSWCGQLWTQEFWPFLMVAERRQYRPDYDLTLEYGEGAEVLHADRYWRSMQDGNSASPAPDAPSADVGVGAAVVALSEEVVFPATTYLVRVSVSGAGDLRVRFDGGDPVAGLSGELWYPGGVHVLSREGAMALRLVADGALAGAVHVSQWVDAPGFDEARWREVLSISEEDVPGYVWDPVVAWEQAGETGIPEDGVEPDNCFFWLNPSIERHPRAVQDVFEDSLGLHAAGARYPVRPWVRFRPEPPVFTAELYDAETSYARGYAVFDGTECYRSLQDANLGHAVTDGDWWGRQSFPAVFLPVVRVYARSELMGKDGRHEAEMLYLRRGDELARKLVDDFFELGGRSRRASVRMRR